MDCSIKSAFVNAGFGAWYPKGSERLERSMIYHGCSHEMLFTREAFAKMDTSKPYRIKYHAVKQAIEQGYTHIIWLDCSLWFTRSPNELMDKLNHDGGFFIHSGYNLAQTCNDNDLTFGKLNRDEAELLPEMWTCIFGFNLLTDKGQKFWHYVEEAFNVGVFDTPRDHANGSADPRYLHARQDQTAVSLAYYLTGYDCAIPPNGIVTDYKHNEHSLIFRQGL
jgi:hypothetical protein